MGTYNVTVSQLASAHTLQSGASPALGAGDTLELTVGGEMATYTFEATDDLQSFAAKINADDAGAASASVVSGRLVLISRETGSAGAITVGGTGAAALGMTQTQAAQDAAATVNGVAVTGSGNTISGAIGGLDLTLTGLGSTTLSVGADTASVEANVQAFVDAYNSVLGTLRDATSYDPTTEVAGRLQGDSSFTGFMSQLRTAAGSSVGSLSGTAYDSLAQIGITASKDGTLTLDSAAFQAAFAADPAAVEEVFAAADGIGQAVDSVVENFTTSVIDPRLDGFTSQIGRFEDQIDAMEDRLAVREERLRREWSAVEVAISQLQNQQAGLLQGLATLGLN
jgi:flagellar hook-associated protein 2